VWKGRGVGDVRGTRRKRQSARTRSAFAPEEKKTKENRRKIKRSKKIKK